MKKDCITQVKFTACFIIASDEWKVISVEIS